jgi:glycosyltransferase involved in cell wall biosynthesis
MKAPISVIILTYNEEPNIRLCLESVRDLSEEIFIVDSFSTDKTLDIAREYTEHIFQNPWTHYAGQRQWALANLPISNDWILFVDADESLTSPLVRELKETVEAELRRPTHRGFYVPRKFFFLGKQLKWGGSRNALKELRLSNRHYLSIAERAGHEVYIVNGAVGMLKSAMIHADNKPISSWIDRHNTYSTQNALYLWALHHQGQVKLSRLFEGTEDNRLYWKETIRENVWQRLPVGFRPMVSFLYHYLFRLGFLDGVEGLLYYFLHDYWFFFLIDAKYIEMQLNNINS